MVTKVSSEKQLDCKPYGTGLISRAKSRGFREFCSKFKPRILTLSRNYIAEFQLLKAWMAFVKFKCKGKLPKPYGVLSQSISSLVLAENQLAAGKAASEEVSIAEMTLKLALKPCTNVTREGCIASHVQQVVELLKV